MTAKPPRFYFSLRSPYSWLAHRTLLRDYPEVAGAVEWIPFWEPDARSDAALQAGGDTFPYSAMSRAKHLYILQDVRRLATAADAAMQWPVDVDPVWEVPHLAYLLADDLGAGRAFVAAAYRARWERGENICDPAVVRDLADELGLPGDRLAAAVEDDELRARGVEVLRRVCRDGVFGVPFFVHRFTRFWGVDRLADFAAHLRSVGVTADDPADDPGGLPGLQPVTVGLGRSSDEGHAGGCG